MLYLKYYHKLSSGAADDLKTSEWRDRPDLPSKMMKKLSELGEQTNMASNITTFNFNVSQ